MAAVAARARVSKPAVHRRWPTKQDLVIAAAASRVGALAVPDLGSFRTNSGRCSPERCSRAHSPSSACRAPTRGPSSRKPSPSPTTSSPAPSAPPSSSTPGPRRAMPGR
ncbi:MULTISPECIES: TetR family transcriptional regulator [unclassified Streptomyces]|uniref:TetR family transcriptional regulator n=1 Tax=unclassified Streptomyces TaxID=2593676 RepID=UPI001F0F89AB|nr:MULTISPECIES: TetR family transcriptional regulator [unclassified Streptomyces]